MICLWSIAHYKETNYYYYYQELPMNTTVTTINETMELQFVYLLPFNTEEEKKHILEVIRQHNQYEHPEDEDEDDCPVGNEVTHIFYARLLKKKPTYLNSFTHAIICGVSGRGKRYTTLRWLLDHNVRRILDFESSMLNYISGKRTWEVIDTDGKVYKQSNKKGGKSELIDDYKWEEKKMEDKKKQKDTTPTKKEEEIDIGWIIHNQRLYKEGNLSQEVKNALEENENWSWDSIPTVYVEKELIKKKCLRKELLKALYELEDLRKKTTKHDNSTISL